MKRQKILASLLVLAALFLPLSAWAEPKVFMAPEGSINGLMIFDQSGFARVYGVFTRGLARFQYDDAVKSIDALKLSFLANSFISSSPALKKSFSAPSNPNDENEVAFIQTEAARFDGTKAKIKGQLIINGIRKDVVMNADLNRYGRVSESTNVMEEGREMTGISMYTSFKRSDYSMSAEATGNIFNDDATIMIDFVAPVQR